MRPLPPLLPLPFPFFSLLFLAVLLCSLLCSRWRAPVSPFLWALLGPAGPSAECSGRGCPSGPNWGALLPSASAPLSCAALRYAMLCWGHGRPRHGIVLEDDLFLGLRCPAEIGSGPVPDVVEATARSARTGTDLNLRCPAEVGSGPFPAAVEATLALLWEKPGPPTLGLTWAALLCCPSALPFCAAPCRDWVGPLP